VTNPVTRDHQTLTALRLVVEAVYDDGTTGRLLETTHAPYCRLCGADLQQRDTDITASLVAVGDEPAFVCTTCAHDPPAVNRPPEGGTPPWS
jgi:hypothetical protein